MGCVNSSIEKKLSYKPSHDSNMEFPIQLNTYKSKSEEISENHIPFQNIQNTNQNKQNIK
jgi:hypothetical protein